MGRATIPAARIPRMTDPASVAGPRNLHIGCAGWSVSRDVADELPPTGTHLERYAAVFRSVEINSSFHRPHRRTTYERWASSVPDDFRFSVKLPKVITHEKRLTATTDVLDTFLGEVNGLGSKLGALLVQLPPSAHFDADVAGAFFEALRARHDGDVFIEPRNKSWFGQVPNRMLVELRIGRVGADPAIIPVAAEPGGISGKVYFRLHGSPQVYYSSYTSSYLDALAFRVLAHARSGGTVWCMFDNTIRGAAMVNALYLRKKIALSDRPAVRR
ncbi:MAG TPA: DUF72 domain-containing protein [Gemmatimonadaceae bacterium]|nr:DUF72 domain-containing protein [Gemmatimonadaceae bacterium]